MTGLGTPLPDVLRGTDDDTRLRAAAWYWEQVRAVHHRWDLAVETGDPVDGGYADAIQELIAGAIDAGVSCLPVEVDGGRRSVPLHELFAPFRRRPNGYRETSDAELRAVLDDPRVPRGRRVGRPRDPEWIP